jgi:stage V sporulation protein B
MNKTSHTVFSPSDFFYNGVISAVSSLALRLAGMIFNVYLSSHAGAQAMGLLALVYSAWGFVLTAGCAGGSLASARMCAESASRKEDVRAACSKCLKYSLVCSVTVGALFFTLASGVGALLCDSRSVVPLRLLAVSLPFVSASGTLSGYFNAVQRSYKNSVCMIAEQVIRVSLTVFIFTRLRHSDAGAYCTAIILGGIVADILSFILQYLLYLNDKRRLPFKDAPCSVTFKKIAAITFPVCISASIRSGLVSIEHVLIPNGLCAFGLSREDALALFGTVHGMAVPIILFCISIPSAFSVLLIPRIAEHNTQKSRGEIRYIASRAYRMALIFSFGVASFLTLSAFLLGDALYPGTDASRYIYLLAPLVPIMYVDSVSDAILKGMGEQLYSMKINIADAAISVICVFFLVPRIGVSGYIIAIYLSEAFNTCASMIRVIKLTGYTVPVFRFAAVPLILSVISANLTSVFYKYSSQLSYRTALILGGIIYTLTFLLLLIICRNLSKEELNYLKGLIVKKGSRKAEAPRDKC